MGLLHTLATLEEHPESVPINALVPVDGTPLADEGKADAPDIWDMGRMIATARVVMPRTMVRLSAGRLSFSESEQVSGMDTATSSTMEFRRRALRMLKRDNCFRRRPGSSVERRWTRNGRGGHM